MFARLSFFDYIELSQNSVGAMPGLIGIFFTQNVNYKAELRVAVRPRTFPMERCDNSAIFYSLNSIGGYYA